ncbi:Protein of unknown function DUF152 [gamma proteobacterium HdN1]|nr:Protein of unknown function DUF152 [gamma proteobacterium HdN1]
MASQTPHPPLAAQWIQPDWPAPNNIRAWVSTRGEPRIPNHPFGRFNTASHVQDDPARVHNARTELVAAFGFQYPPLWLDQVHGTDVVRATPDTRSQAADAVITDVPGLPITIHTADCLPVFFCNRSGTQIALAHAGWRGLAAGVIENTVEAFSEPPQNLIVWLGPAIGPQAFEVGDDVRQAFLRHDPEHEAAFIPTVASVAGESIETSSAAAKKSSSAQHWHCDLYLLARQRLRQLGITQISGGNFCTATDDCFYSFRRDSKTGRMLSILWLNP